ncbi:Putative invertase inhibitor [Morus notabilis]|uniref:Putative invertase inhibitor n=1 Tax=Morus notabilis TaxID=981085 RepID=W9S5H3_9ROSA|nr:putative invertase inhibitor [Morus notabilis]EXC26733.1 Putative invertase inhibitor [Morus notabilis]
MRFPFFSIYIFIFIFLLLQHCSLGSHDLIHRSCKKAAKSDPNLSYTFCVTSLEANLKNKKNVTDLEELAFASLDLTTYNATKIASKISMLLRQKIKVIDHPYAKNCLKDCQQLYSDAVSSLRDAKRDFKWRNFDRVNVEISSAMDASSTCQDGFGEKKGEVSPLTQENNVFFQWTVISLVFINMFAHQ